MTFSCVASWLWFKKFAICVKKVLDYFFLLAEL